MSRARLDHFDALPGVWQEGDFYSATWAQIRAQLSTGAPLNRSERKVLLALLDRMAARPAARKALGIRPEQRQAERNRAIADLYITVHEYEGKSPREAETQVLRKFPDHPGSVRAVIESNRYLGPARARMLAKHLARCGNTRAPQKIG